MAALLYPLKIDFINYWKEKNHMCASFFVCKLVSLKYFWQRLRLKFA